MKLTAERLQLIHVLLGVGSAIVAIVKYWVSGHLDPTFAIFACTLMGISSANDYFNSPPDHDADDSGTVKA